MNSVSIISGALRIRILTATHRAKTPRSSSADLIFGLFRTNKMTQPNGLILRHRLNLTTLLQYSNQFIRRAAKVAKDLDLGVQIPCCTGRIIWISLIVNCQTAETDQKMQRIYQTVRQKGTDCNLKLKQAQSSILTKLGQKRKKREEEQRIIRQWGKMELA